MLYYIYSSIYIDILYMHYFNTVNIAIPVYVWYTCGIRVVYMLYSICLYQHILYCIYI